MKAVDLYYDFRSPYAYFASKRLDLLTSKGADIQWKPVCIDVLLNLQANRDPWAPYADPLAPPKRQHLIYDVARMAAFWKISFKKPNPRRPRSVEAMCIATRLAREGVEHSIYRTRAFDALWKEQQDLGDLPVISHCLSGISTNVGSWEDERAELAENTLRAYGLGVFGVPTFLFEGQPYWGADRMEVLASILQGSAPDQWIGAPT
jgi:2-hydroxychromene-2-carboxylate isomerase